MVVSVVTAGVTDDKSKRLRSIRITFIRALYFIASKLCTNSAN